MELKKIDKNSSDYQTIKELYLSAFPKEERAPFRMLVSKSKLDFVDWWSIYDNDTYVGMFYVLYNDDLVYLFYFAIMESMRGSGYGTKSLELLKQHYKGKRIFLSIEEVVCTADNYLERVKRKEFYERCGFVSLGSKVKEGGVIYELLGIGGPVNNTEYTELIVSWMGKLYAKIIGMEIL